MFIKLIKIVSNKNAIKINHNRNKSKVRMKFPPLTTKKDSDLHNKNNKFYNFFENSLLYT